MVETRYRHFLCLWGATLLAMPTGAQETQRTRNVAFVIWDGAELIEFTGPAQIFHFAPGFNEYTVAETTAPVHSYFVTITPEYTFENCPKPDVVVVPAGVFMMRNANFNDWLRKVVPEAEAVISVCNGSLLLANAGLLDGHEATAPNGNLDDLMILGRNIRGYVNRRFVDSGKFVTSDSYFAGVDGALCLVTKLAGPEAAEQSAKRNLYNWRPEDWARELAEPGIVPQSRRRELYFRVMNKGVESAVIDFQAMKASGEPGYDPPLDTLNEENMFRWLGWNLQNALRFEQAAKWCEFTAKAFPESAMSRACYGEYLLLAGRAEEALAVLLEAISMQGDLSHALRFLKQTLGNPQITSSGEARQARAILRTRATEPVATLVPDGEPGEPLLVSGTIHDDEGRPVDGALVYAFHTDAQGCYSPGGMDETNPRLFGYMKTGPDGRYDFRTIRPGHYPDQTEPVEQHIHYEIAAVGFAPKQHRLSFADDPIWNRAGLADDPFWSRHQPFPPRWAAPVTRGSDGIDRCVCDITLMRG